MRAVYEQTTSGESAESTPAPRPPSHASVSMTSSQPTKFGYSVSVFVEWNWFSFVCHPLYPPDGSQEVAAVPRWSRPLSSCPFSRQVSFLCSSSHLLPPQSLYTPLISCLSSSHLRPPLLWSPHPLIYPFFPLPLPSSCPLLSFTSSFPLIWSSCLSSFPLLLSSRPSSEGLIRACHHSVCELKLDTADAAAIATCRVQVTHLQPAVSLYLCLIHMTIALFLPSYKFCWEQRLICGRLKQ